MQFHTAVSQSRFLCVAKVPPYVEPKEPEKTTALMATAAKKQAFRARSGVGGMHRV